jgi:uncharacterized protein (TIGR02145 family)
MKTKKSQKERSLFVLVLLSILFIKCTPETVDPVSPKLTTSNVSSITANSATSGGSISDEGGASVTSRGVCWNTSSGPTTSNNKTSDGSGPGSFTSSLTGLNSGITYYVKAFATNSAGTGYGNEVSFTTLAIAPTLTTSVITAVTTTTASSGGNISGDGGGAITARGICWGTSQNPTIANSKTTDGTGTGSFTSSITGLAPATVYYVRAYATNSAGTAYGNQLTFTTNQNLSLATVSTSAVTNIATTTATVGGNVTSDGNATVTERGTVISANPNPTTAGNKFPNGTGTGTFSSNITGFTANTTYYIRAYAINSQGTAYGNEVSFKTNATSGSTVTDIDGNVYNTVTIGTQVWMAENLKTTKYRNGDPIPNVTAATSWITLKTGAYCWYNNDAAKKATFGALYNWYAVADSRNIAPLGWHVPSDAEWTVLTNFLGGETVAGGKLKAVDPTQWMSPNIGATNSSGFTAIPSGYRDFHGGNFYSEWSVSYFWTRTEYPTAYAWARELFDNSAEISRGPYTEKECGVSVRCVKD